MFYDFALPRTVIGPDWSVIGLALLLHPIRYKSEIIRDLVTYVSHASCSLFVFTFSSHWLMLFSFLPVGCRNYLVLVLRRSIEMCSKIGNQQIGTLSN